MELSHKHNWPEARDRLEAYWNMEAIGRPCIAVTAPLGERRPVAPPADYRAKWTDPEYVAQSLDAAHEATYFGGEAMPGGTLMVGYCYAYGAPLHFTEQTVWQDAIIESWDDAPSFELDESDWAWQQCEKVVRRCTEVAAGRWFAPMPALMQPNDLLWVLRGPERFCLDLLERGGKIKATLRRILDNYLVQYERLQAIISETMEGSMGWLSVWHPSARSLTLQSDLSCAISEAMFEEFIAPELEELCDWLDGAIYHLDGPGALHQLDRLLAIEGLHAIQWTPGTGQPTGLAWLELYKRIQEAGKGLVISLAYDEVETAVKELRPEGVLISTSAPSPEAAEGLLERATTALALR